MMSCRSRRNQFCHSEEVGAATDEESALGVNEKQIPLPRQRDRNDRLARWEAAGFTQAVWPGLG